MEELEESSLHQRNGTPPDPLSTFPTSITLSATIFQYVQFSTITLCLAKRKWILIYCFWVFVYFRACCRGNIGGHGHRLVTPTEKPRPLDQVWRVAGRCINSFLSTFLPSPPVSLVSVRCKRFPVDAPVFPSVLPLRKAYWTITSLLHLYHSYIVLFRSFFAFFFLFCYFFAFFFFFFFFKYTKAIKSKCRQSAADHIFCVVWLLPLPLIGIHHL